MDRRIITAWALGLLLAVTGAYAEEPSEKKPESHPAAGHADDSAAKGDIGLLVDRLEIVSARLGQIVDEKGEAESREVAQQCRELVASLRDLLRSQSATKETDEKLPQALEAIKQLACDGDNCPIDGKLVQNQDLQGATVGELFARLRDVQVSDEEREEFAREVERDRDIELVEVVLREDGEEEDEKTDGETELKGNDEEKRFEKSKQKLEAAQERRKKRELEAFARSIAAKVQEAQRVDNPAQQIERLRDIAGAIRERAADVVENDAERAFDMLRNAERIESRAREVARQSDNERARLQRGERDQPPARPRPDMPPPAMMGPPPGMMGPPPDVRHGGAASVPPDPRGKAMMAQRLLMAAGLKKEANIVAEAIEREFAADPATMKRLRAEITELQTANARLRAALENREAALKEQIQALRKEAMKREQDQDAQEDEEDDDD